MALLQRGHIIPRTAKNKLCDEFLYTSDLAQNVVAEYHVNIITCSAIWLECHVLKYDTQNTDLLCTCMESLDMQLSEMLTQG